MRTTVKSRIISCPWCSGDKKAKVFSAYGRDDGYGYMVSVKYISCENKGCIANLIGEAAGSPIKILPLDLSIIDNEFVDPIDREKIKEFVKNVLGLNDSFPLKNPAPQ